MSARKLQQEMDRVFKRVAEGCGVFDNIYNKLQNSTNQTQKEKLEHDLKREIKKLQKLRDQIKTWIASNDIRDKKQLLDQRRLIENDMERFKAVEREVKTKAYSKEGLMRANDPYYKEKHEAIEFLQTKMEELEQQVESLEEEQDQLQQTTKRGKKSDSGKQERLNEIDHALERHKWHISNMETMVSMIENDKLAPESVMDLQEDINYYVECNQEVDFAEDEAIYDELRLVGDNDDEIVETIVRDDTYTLEDLAQDLSKEAAKEAAQKEKEDRERERKEKLKEKEKLDKRAEKEGSPMSTSSVHVSTQVSAHASGQVSSSGSGSASNVYSSTPSPSRAMSPSTPGISPLPPPSVPAPKNAEPVKKGGHLAQGGATAPTPIARSGTSTARESPMTTPFQTPSLVHSVPIVHHGSVIAQAQKTQSSGSASGSEAPSSSSNTGAPVAPPASSAGSSHNVSSTHDTSIQSAPGSTLSSAPASAGSTNVTANSTLSLPVDINKLPPGIQDIVGCLEDAKQRLQYSDSVLQVSSISKLIQHSYLSTPDSAVSDIPNYYHPQNPYPTPDYYPQEVLSSLEDPEVFREMHVDTLFYVFYYCQNTHQQYLAAKELKNRSWRFHKKFLTWFQRQEDPKIITPEYEEGTYRFFDFEGSWVQRRKNNFVFEFKYLEDELV
ncbi:CCR4-NOT core subunit [Starmerella bacillaris]|uniref:General negative regulator of transcription subunit n=1 Tax=Starmerella bacillaris TaxID=1247836 RepID=A0AAV5RJS3_STABA|nr:CCR4-NOT core subunit [Starmerella bacillaris]